MAAERFVPKELEDTPDEMRRARLIVRFGFLGALFGLAYMLFYLLVGHYWGAGIVVVCSLLFFATPWLLRRTKALNFAGNLLSGIMVAGFTGLCSVEGGMQGHAIAWLVSVPLCTLLLVGKQAAKWWVIVSFLSIAGVMAAAMSGIHMPKTYPAEWDTLITATGYLGLIPFMYFLGMIFETSREKAFGKMQRALEDLEISNEQLKALNREKDEFMGIAAHDLKNPLTVIIGNAELIGHSRNPGQLLHLVDNIKASGTRMYDLIKNLLDANAIEEGKFKLRPERCDLVNLVEVSLEHNHLNASRKGIEIKAESHGTVWAWGDENATLQILDNLVSNAIKYSLPESMVGITIKVEGAWAKISVKDEGPGLSEEDQKELFHKFARLSAKPTGGESSNGLGLSIVKKLANIMGGEVGCQSVLGQGATFTVSLPVWDNHKVKTGAGAAVSEQ